MIKPPLNKIPIGEMGALSPPLSVEIGVVEGAPMVVGDHRVLRKAGVQGSRVVRKDVLQEGERPRAADDKSPHVGDVEEAGRFPCGEVLLHDPGAVLERHVQAAEIDHRGAERNMLVVQDGL